MQCIICGRNSWKLLFEAQDRMFRISGKFNEHQCTSCGLIRLAPRLSGRALKKYYPSTNYYSYKVDASQSFFGRLRTFLIRNKFFGVVPAMPRTNRGKILDLGCGAGDTLMLLKELGWDAYGLDIDPNAIRAAHKRGLSNVSLGSHKDILKYPDNFFDVVRLYHVIEHIDNPLLCLSLVHRKLKPGGEIIMGTPNGVSLVAKIAKQYWYNLDCPRHLFIFSPSTLQRLAQKEKLTTTSVEYSSAGGWVGSIQYKLKDRWNISLDLINRPLLIILFYPLEWILDLFHLGDIFVLRAKKI